MIFNNFPGERPNPAEFPEYEDDLDSDKYEKIPSTDVGWTERRDEMRDKEQGLDIFGGGIVALADMVAIHKNIGKGPIPVMVEHVEKELGSKNKLLSHLAIEEPQLAERFFHSYCVSTLGVQSSKETISDAAKKLANQYAKGGLLSNEEFLQALKAYHHDIQEPYIALRETIQSYKDSVFKTIFEAIAKQKIPVDPLIAKQRLTHVLIEILDPINAKLRGIIGDYDYSRNIMRFEVGMDKDMCEQVLTHEAMHALSGTVELAVINQDFPEFDSYATRKHGLRLGTIGLFKPDQPDFNWLSEAITEDLAMELIGTKRGSYGDYRAVLNLLVAQGLPKKTIREAYFENYSGKTAHDTPKLKKLFTQSNKFFGPRFLVNLDFYMRTIQQTSTDSKEYLRALKSFLEDWRADDKRFPLLLDATVREIKREKISTK